jgi:HSP20 family molecular chaperone IbpA
VSEDASIQQDTSPQIVPANIYRTDDRVMVAAAMPGLHPDDIRISVGPGTLLKLQGDLRGALKDAKEIVCDEWTPGPYYRELELPEPVDGPRANVTYHNGVVVIALPVAAHTAEADLRLTDGDSKDGERVGHRGQPSKA